MQYKIEELEYDIALDACITKHAAITTFNVSATDGKRSGLNVTFDIVSIQTYPYKFPIV